jgi:uncharacterized protein with PIN domain
MSQRNEPRFLVDFMLGRLAKWLRIIGYDAVYSRERDKTSILMQSLIENRILVTRDHEMARNNSRKIILVQSDRIGNQLRQVLTEENLQITIQRFFTRCTLCNILLQPVADKETVASLVPAYVLQSHEAFSRCAECGKIYWKGTHLDLLVKELAKAGIRIGQG